MVCVQVFMDEYIIFNECRYLEQIDEVNGDWIQWQVLLLMEEWKEKVKQVGLWNLFLLDVEYGVGLINCDYVSLVEIMGYCLFVFEVFNCSVFDIGNMEVFYKYGFEVQKKQWLELLLEGIICFVFFMIEFDVVLFDVINMEVICIVEGDEVVINGCKWWSFGVGYLDCKVGIFMGVIDFDVFCYSQYLMVLVLLDIFGVKIECMLLVFNCYDVLEGYGEVLFMNVCVLKENIIVGFGCGFEIVQGCFGLGCIYYCMCLVGVVE